MMLSTVTILLSLPVSATAAGDGQLNYLKERYAKELESASAKRAEAIGKADKEFTATKNKLLTTLINAYADTIKRVTQTGDLEAANLLLAEKKRLEAERNGEAKPEAEAAAAKPPASGSGPQLEALYGTWEADMSNWSKGTARTFELKSNGVLIDRRTYVTQSGRSTTTHQYQMHITATCLSFQSMDSSSSTQKHYLEIKPPFDANTLLLDEIFESPTHTNRRQFKLTHSR